MNRLRGAIALCLLALGLLVAPAAAQDADHKSLFGDLNSRFALLETLVTIERTASRIHEVETTALLSEYGNWPNDPAWKWPEDANTTKLVYDLNNVKPRISVDVANLRRTVKRSRGLSEQEKAALLDLLAELDLMLDQSETLYRLLADKRLSDAASLFHTDASETYRSVMSRSYTLSADIKNDVRRIGLDFRKVK